MSDADFDISSLAAYLHMTPQQVTRLVERSKIPGRRVGGKWRFSHAEIHHWLEKRIGVSDDQELARMEQALRQHSNLDEQNFTIEEMMSVDAISVSLPAKTKSSVISSMTELASTTGWLWDPQKMAEAVRVREEMMPTAIDGGIALLHPRRPMPSILGQAFITLGCTPSGIPFGNQRGELTDIFFLICSINDQGHLRTLARISRLISDPEVVGLIRTAPSTADVYDMLIERDNSLSS